MSSESLLLALSHGEPIALHPADVPLLEFVKTRPFAFSVGKLTRGPACSRSHCVSHCEALPDLRSEAGCRLGAVCRANE